VVVETLFVYPGIGFMLIQAALFHDVPVLETCVLVIAVVYLFSNLIADIIVALLNPRIRMGG